MTATARSKMGCNMQSADSGRDVYGFLAALDRSQDLASLIVDSGFFDPLWYQDHYMHGLSKRPIEHYIQTGLTANYNPSTKFSCDLYYHHYDDVREQGAPAFLHFLMHGSIERRLYFPFSEGNYADLSVQLPDLSDMTRYLGSGGLAVAAHVFYPELWDELNTQIAAITVSTNMFISLVRGRSDHLATRILENHPSACIKIFPNHGRDVFPFTEFLNAGAFDGCDLLCKLHTKKSLHRNDGAYWRQTLYTELLGSQINVDHILRAFRHDDTLGIFVPDGHRESYMGVNESLVRVLLNRINLPLDTATMVFPAGNMFWMRGSCLAPLKALDMRYTDYALEAGQLDGTVGHAFERVIGVVCAALNKRILTTADIAGACVTRKSRMRRFFSKIISKLQRD